MIRVDRIKQKEKEMDIERRVYNRNIVAMTFCNEQGLLIYPSAQAHSSNMVKLFVQKDSKFKPLSDIEYDQTKAKEVNAYIAAIDAEYERLYIKMKDKINK
tara:strand:+ start:202 stop:504 length:303 start_codon:yes stop_codon:yes gene_type:complete